MADIKQILEADCCNTAAVKVEQPRGMVDLNTSTFITNLDGAKWVYGNTTQEEQKLKMFALSTKANVTKCKVDSPITINGKSCTQCPLEKPIWNIGEGRCVSCPADQEYSASEHVCKGHPKPEVPKINAAPVTSRSCQQG